MEQEPTHEQPLCHDYVSMTPEAIHLRELIDHLGDRVIHIVENLSVDD